MFLKTNALESFSAPETAGLLRLKTSSISSHSARGWKSEALSFDISTSVPGAEV